MKPYRNDRGAGFYVAALEYAQSLWMEGKPAQAILQLNKAMSADLTENEATMAGYAAPYRALVWILKQDVKGRFLGNPVRHFQHLATRMCGPRSEVRSWRAWACFHLSEGTLPRAGFPRDEEQIRREKLTIPTTDRVLDALAVSGWLGERDCVAELLAESFGDSGD